MELEKLSVKEIDKFMKEVDVLDYPQYIPKLLEDKRQSIQKLGSKFKNNYKKYHEEYERVMNLWKYENYVYDNGYNLVAGLDEAGRGPLAGPVVAAAVILPKGLFIEGINDSKKISKTKRENIYNIIQKEAIGVGIGVVDNETIDKINILNATKLAMTQAIKKLLQSPEFLLIDALELPNIAIDQKPLIQGDSKSISIAAASIIAKVFRDKAMVEYSNLYPDYNFDVHKGYGTAKHYEAIRKYGITPIHRKTFLKSMVKGYENRTSY